MWPFIYGDRASMAGRWKFWIVARKRSWARVTEGLTGRPSRGWGGAWWEDKGTDKLTGSRSSDLSEGCTPVTGQFSASLKPSLSLSSFGKNECFSQFSTHAHTLLCVLLQWSRRQLAVVAGGHPTVASEERELVWTHRQNVICNLPDICYDPCFISFLDCFCFCGLFVFFVARNDIILVVAGQRHFYWLKSIASF